MFLLKTQDFDLDQAKQLLMARPILDQTKLGRYIYALVMNVVSLWVWG